MLEIHIITQPNAQGVIFIDKVIYYAGKMSWCRNGLPESEIKNICSKENVSLKDIEVINIEHDDNILDIKDIGYALDPWNYYHNLKK